MDFTNTTSKRSGSESSDNRTEVVGQWEEDENHPGQHHPRSTGRPQRTGKDEEAEDDEEVPDTFARHCCRATKEDALGGENEPGHDCGDSNVESWPAKSADRFDV